MVLTISTHIRGCKVLYFSHFKTIPFILTDVRFHSSEMYNPSLMGYVQPYFHDSTCCQMSTIASVIISIANSYTVFSFSPHIGFLLIFQSINEIYQ